MARNNKFLTGLVLILLGLFVFGLTYLFILRFKKGDIYPAYSSLRADPLGSKIFYESLEYMSGISIARNYQPLKKLHEKEDMVVFYIGLREYFFMRGDLIRDFELLAAAGNRLVISFFPIKKKISKESQEEKEGKKACEKCKKCEGCEIKETEDEEPYPLTERWGVKLAYAELSETPEADALLNGDAGFELETPVSWHTNRYFDNLKENWQVIYSWEERPVVISRRWGKGTIVLCSDSYFFSNEAMYYERHPRLLSWLVGENTKIVFDETHHRIRENPGIMKLARKYHLHGLFAGIILLILLFLWKNFSPFIPPYEKDVIERGVGLAYGKNEFVGFISLLRRNISRRNVLHSCFEQWEKTMARRMKEFGDRPERMQAVVDAGKKQESGKRDPIEDYRVMSKILTERRKIK